VLDENNGDAALSDLRDQITHRIRFRMIQSGSRLIEQQYLRIGSQCTRYFESF
jgi:hypothetical protein